VTSQRIQRPRLLGTRGSERVLLLCLLPFLSSCDKSSDPPRPAQYDLELPVEAPSPSYVDNDFSLRAGTPKLCPQSGVLGPASGMLRIAIPVEIELKSQRSLPVGPMLFLAATRNGTYRPTLAGCQDPFPARTLTVPATVKSHVTFDLPQDYKELQLVYEPFIIGRKAVSARVLVPN
jgi:hypothetical protein